MIQPSKCHKMPWGISEYNNTGCNVEGGYNRGARRNPCQPSSTVCPLIVTSPSNKLAVIHDLLIFCWILMRNGKPGDLPEHVIITYRISLGPSTCIMRLLQTHWASSLQQQRHQSCWNSYVTFGLESGIELLLLSYFTYTRRFEG